MCRSEPFMAVPWGFAGMTIIPSTVAGCALEPRRFCRTSTIPTVYNTRCRQSVGVVPDVGRRSSGKRPSTCSDPS